MARHETAARTFEYLVTGHFIREGDYFTWRTHGSSDHLLVLTLAGCGRFGYGAGEIMAERGDIMLLHPHTLHDYGLEPGQRRWELLWAHFHARPHWQNWLRWPAVSAAKPGLMHLRPPSDAFDQIVRRMSDVNALASGASPLRDLFAMNALEEVLLRCHGEIPTTGQRPMDGRVQSAMEFFCQNLAGAIRLDHAADAVGLSPSRLAHLFREQAGISPQRFLERQRLSRATQLLATTQLSVKEIAHQIGFTDPFYFTQRFKHQFGVPPKAYRLKTLQ